MTQAIQRIPFHDDELYAVVDERTGKEYVLPKPIADLFGLHWSSQLKKLHRTQYFKKGMVIMTIPSAGGEQQTVLLERRLIYPWLLSIDASRVTEALQEKLRRYQEECAAVLDAYFMQGQAINPRGGTVSPPLPLPTPRETLDTLASCRAALQALGTFDDRDTIQFSAYVRRVAATAMQPLLPPGTGDPLGPDLTQPVLWTLSMRMQFLKYPPLSGPDAASHQIRIGTRAAKAYRATYKEDPKKLWDFVQGQQRQVNAYLPERVDVLDNAIASVLGPPRLQVVQP